MGRARYPLWTGRPKGTGETKPRLKELFHKTVVQAVMTAVLLIAYRLGAHVPTPGIDGHALAQFFEQVQGTLLGMVDLFSGGNLRRLSIFALGIMDCR